MRRWTLIKLFLIKSWLCLILIYCSIWFWSFLTIQSHDDESSTHWLRRSWSPDWLFIWTVFIIRIWFIFCIGCFSSFWHFLHFWPKSNSLWEVLHFLLSSDFFHDHSCQSLYFWSVWSQIISSLLFHCGKLGSFKIWIWIIFFLYNNFLWSFSLSLDLLFLISNFNFFFFESGKSNSSSSPCLKKNCL